MGLLDSVLGAVMGGQQPQSSATAQGGLGSIISMVANNPQLLQAITGMLSNEGGQGGLGGLMAKFQQAGILTQPKPAMKKARWRTQRAFQSWAAQQISGTVLLRSNPSAPSRWTCHPGWSW